MSKSIVLAVLAGVFDIEMGRNFPLPAPPMSAAFYPDDEHVVSNAMARPRKWKEEDEEESPSSYFVDASAVSCSGEIPKPCRHACHSSLLPHPSVAPAPSRRVATRLHRSRDPLRQISPCYLSPAGYSAARVNKKIGDECRGGEQVG